MIRKSLVVGLFLALAYVFIGHAHAAEAPSWSESYVASPMRATSRFLTRHIDHLVGRTGHGYRTFSRYTRSGAEGVTAAAARFIGTNPTGWPHDWCAVFVNRILARQGYRTSGSAMAISFAHYGPHVAPRPNAIAVLRGHVGFVESVQGDRIVLVSGNGGHRPGVKGRVTARNTYSRRSFVAFVMPSRARY